MNEIMMKRAMDELKGQLSIEKYEREKLFREANAQIMALVAEMIVLVSKVGGKAVISKDEIEAIIEGTQLKRSGNEAQKTITLEVVVPEPVKPKLGLVDEHGREM